MHRSSSQGICNAQVEDAVADSPSTLTHTSWGSKTAILLFHASIWVLYHIVLRGLAGLLLGFFHSLLPFVLAVAYWALKNAFTYYLPRSILFGTRYVTTASWAMCKGWLLVVGFALEGSSCAVVSSHKLRTKTEREHMMLQQVSNPALFWMLSGSSFNFFNTIAIFTLHFLLQVCSIVLCVSDS